MSTQNGTTPKPKTTKTTSVVKPKVKEAVKALVVKKDDSKTKSQAEIIKQRMDKRMKLSTMYKDIDALTKAQSDFDSIQSFSDIRVVIYSGQSATFSTTRQDTVTDVMDTIQKNIDQKLLKAQKELAEFEF